ncbi:MAG: putative metalloprotease CJM1_0395 family protein [Alphaproteobacteria bacterium]
MVAAVSSGANIVALFGSRPVPPVARADSRTDKVFEVGNAAPDKGEGKAPAGGPPRNLLSFEGAASLQEGESGTGNQLTEQERAEVAELKARDVEVRAHERAHAAAGGQHAGSPSYEFQRGPDGRDYAVGGEVPIDSSPIAGDPKATIEKMEQVKAAALAPAEPSGQDRKVAAQAEAERQKAVRELNAQKAEEAKAAREGDNADDGFEAFTASDFRRVGPAPSVSVAPSTGPTRPAQPSVIDISV